MKRNLRESRSRTIRTLTDQVSLEDGHLRRKDVVVRVMRVNRYILKRDLKQSRSRQCFLTQTEDRVYDVDGRCLVSMLKLELVALTGVEDQVETYELTQKGKEWLS